MRFTSPNSKGMHARLLVWAHCLGSCCTGGSSREPSRQVTLPTRLRLLPCGLWCLGLRQSFIFLQAQLDPALRSLILGNEPHPLLMASRSPFLVGRETSAIQVVDFCHCGRIAPGNQLRDNIVWTSGSQTRPLPLKNSCKMYVLIWVYFMQTPFNYVFSPLHSAYYMSLMFSCTQGYSVWVECFHGRVRFFPESRGRRLKLLIKLRQSKQPPHSKKIKCQFLLLWKQNISDSRQEMTF